MKLSIIIPVYKTQDTLDRCLKSILSQSFTDYEIILVDDGSPDNCPQICDKYAENDYRIRVIHKENGGLSDARNVGIEHAQGEYITFVDSDDAIDNHTLQPLMEELQRHPNVDVLEYPIMERVGNPQKEHLLTFQPKDYHSPIDYWFAEQAYLHTYACNKIFKRCLFEYVRFPKDKTFEDALTTPYLIGLVTYNVNTRKKMSPIIRVTNTGRYIYYWNPNSITVLLDYKDMYHLYEGHIHTLKEIFENIDNITVIINKYNASLQNYMAKILNYMLYINNATGIYMEDPPLVKYLQIVAKESTIFPIKLKLLLILGYHRLCKLNRIIHKIYKRHS